MFWREAPDASDLRAQGPGCGARSYPDDCAAAQEARPELPRGPFLVVGLARSGQAAARLLAGRGEAVVGVDSGASGWGCRASGGWCRSLFGCRRTCAPRWGADGGEEPGGAAGGAGDRGGAGAGDRRGWGAGGCLEGDSQSVRRGDRDEREDDDRRAAGARLPDGWGAGGGSGERGDAALCAGWGDRCGCDRDLRGVELSAGGQRCLCARVRGLPQPRAGPPRPAQGSGVLSGGQAADLCQPGQRRPGDLQRRRSGAL